MQRIIRRCLCSENLPDVLAHLVLSMGDVGDCIRPVCHMIADEIDYFSRCGEHFEMHEVAKSFRDVEPCPCKPTFVGFERTLVAIDLTSNVFNEGIKAEALCHKMHSSCDDSKRTRIFVVLGCLPKSLHIGAVGEEPFFGGWKRHNQSLL